jgi:enediyne polyketide synthase
VTGAIAIVGMACRLPDAQSPAELWENVLARRRAFRAIPPERLRLEDYGSPDRAAADHTYVREAAVLADYEFDRVGFRVAGRSFRAADLTHWLALDVAAQALADAGSRDGERLPRRTTAVIIGNSLTGEFARANMMRLRWPYVRRAAAATVAELGWPADRGRDFLRALEVRYKAPFAPADEETLAGGLSNTIAGRICNQFDFQGGGYTVDGACASSLLAVAHACAALTDGDADVALAGGVDLSLDPFELVGFARTGALAEGEMRVYDARPTGFCPGEGCGMVVLMRHEDAMADGRRVYAVVRGWGVSSDGSGGLTRPEVDGQLLALRRAYGRAGFGMDSVSYFEGHGTGTAVGDAAELRALSIALHGAGAKPGAVVIGSVKANIGHTKAAAGVAGLIKTVMALRAQLLPPATGCEKPHADVTGDTAVLRVALRGEPWPAGRPLRAGVSAMGFGGINTHVVLEGSEAAGRRASSLTSHEHALLASAQDAELFLLGTESAQELSRLVTQLLARAPRMSYAELADLAIALAQSPQPTVVRAALVASAPTQLARGLETLRSWLGEPGTCAPRLDARAGVFLGRGGSTPRIGFVFPGQGSPAYTDGGALLRRYAAVEELYARAALRAGANGVATEVAQPAIVAASLAGLHALREFGVEATVAVGHSLGELSALHWAGALDADALLRIARARGRAMGSLGTPTGAMASIAAGRREVEALLDEGGAVVVAGVNSPRQTVVAGRTADVDRVVERARGANLAAVRLRVSHAFHSPLVAAAAAPLLEFLAGESLRPLSRAVASTITGQLLAPNVDLRALLGRQVTSPVLFLDALNAASPGVDLWIEVGPGQVLSGIIADVSSVSALPLDAGGASLRGLLVAVGAAFALGAPLNVHAAGNGRFARPFDLTRDPRFLRSPCELVPVDVGGENRTADADDRPDTTPTTAATETAALPAAATPFALVRELVARRAELPVDAVRDDHGLLRDLHLNSISVAQIAAEAARGLGLRSSGTPTEFTTKTVGEVARALEVRLRSEGASASAANGAAHTDAASPRGVDTWVRPFVVERIERPAPTRAAPGGGGEWRVIATGDYPLTENVRLAFAGFGGGGGVVVCLPPSPDERHLPLLLEGARAVQAESGPRRFVLVQHGGGAAAFARTLRQEAPEVATCVVDVPADPHAVRYIVAEAAAVTGFSEAEYDAEGRRYESVLRPLWPDQRALGPPLGPEDVLLATGGGRGITAECVLALARATGVRVIVVGTSRPGNGDTELAANLERMQAAGITVHYVSVDVSDARATREAVARAQAAVGRITAVLHGAGVHAPCLLSQLDEAGVLRAVAPKVQGLRNVLAAIDPASLRLLVTFGSTIGRSGMRGAAAYALANEWVRRLTEEVQATWPPCRCVVLEWSIWSGVGMGARFGQIDALVRAGFTPIPPDVGVELFTRLLAVSLPAVSVVVTGRYGDPPLLPFDAPELPLLRFLELPRIHYGGVELVADAELSPTRDPYLDDHVFRGERLFPAVMGLEAMAQVAMALTGSIEPPIFERVSFDRPIVASAHEAVTIRVAALARERDRLDVVVRTGETDFAADHFRAVCRVPRTPSSPPVADARAPTRAESAAPPPPVPIAPARDLYGSLLFQRGRFQRVGGYRRLTATSCVADLTPDGHERWFGGYLPNTLVLGDPGARDAAVHAVQACVPDLTLLPSSVDHVVLTGPLSAGDEARVCASERSRDGGLFVYDVDVVGTDGRVRERWDGLRLRVVEPARLPGGWPAPLLGPYIERRLRELAAASDLSAVVDVDDTAGEGDATDAATARQRRSERAIHRALGAEMPVRRRPDGRPEVAVSRHVSSSHAGALTMAVAGRTRIACDVEPVRERTADTWRDVLTVERYALAQFVAREAREGESVAATRVWSAAECLVKAEGSPDAPLVLESADADGWVTFRTGAAIVATYVARLRGNECPLVLAVLAVTE